LGHTLNEKIYFSTDLPYLLKQSSPPYKEGDRGVVDVFGIGVEN